MGILLAGVLLWSAVHLMKSITPGIRSSIIQKTGTFPHQGLVALLIVISVILMVIGWRSADYIAVYDPPEWGRHFNMLTMLFAIWLLVAANVQSRIKRIIRHPMLTGMLVLSGGHLLANGDSRSLILFAGLGAWSLISIFSISAREGPRQELAISISWIMELVFVLITIFLYAVLFVTHQWFTGVPLVPQ